MQRLRKIIFWVAIVSILLLIILPFVISAFSLEFTNDNDEMLFDQLRFLGLPLAILFTLTGTLRAKDSSGFIITKIIATLFIAFIPVLFAFATALDGMCTWTTTKILFENKKNPTIKIVLRHFGCGATDSSSPTPGIFKIKYYTSHFISTSSFDTTSIDPLVWIRVVENSK